MEGGRERRPFRGEAEGRLTYTAEGRMCVAIMRRGRPHAPTRTLSAAPTQVRATLASGYLSYAGRWRREGDDVVVHAVEVSLLPNWVGTEQRRLVAWIADDEGDHDLELSTAPEPTEGGRTTVNRLRWRRIQPEEGP